MRRDWDRANHMVSNEKNDKMTKYTRLMSWYKIIYDVNTK